MSSRYTSRIYAVWKALHEALSFAEFSPANGQSPVILFGDPFGETESGREWIGIVFDIENADREWARMSPAGRDENFTVQVVVRSEVPGRTGAEVVDRLEELTNTIEGLFYDTETRAVADPLSVAGVVNLSRVGTPRPEVRATDEGYEGVAVVPISIQTRI